MCVSLYINDAFLWTYTHISQQTWVLKYYYCDWVGFLLEYKLSTNDTTISLHLFHAVKYFFVLSFRIESSIRLQWWMQKVMPALFSTLTARCTELWSWLNGAKPQSKSCQLLQIRATQQWKQRCPVPELEHILIYLFPQNTVVIICFLRDSDDCICMSVSWRGTFLQIKRHIRCPPNLNRVW